MKSRFISTAYLKCIYIKPSEDYLNLEENRTTYFSQITITVYLDVTVILSSKSPAQIES